MIMNQNYKHIKSKVNRLTDSKTVLRAKTEWDTKVKAM